MSIFEKGLHLDPNYDFLDKYCGLAFDSDWNPAKYKQGIEKRDVPNIINKLPKRDRIAIERCLSLIHI